MDQIKIYNKARDKWNEFVAEENDPDEIIRYAVFLTKRLLKSDIDNKACTRIGHRPIMALALDELKGRFGNNSPVVRRAVDTFEPLKTWQRGPLDSEDASPTYTRKGVFRSEIPEELVEDREVSAFEVRLALVISKACAASKHGARETKISNATLMARLGVSLPTIQRAKRNLAKAGWLVVRHAQNKPDSFELLETKRSPREAK